MALNANVASTWKELTAHGRADAWKDIVEGFQNVEGVWTVIYSSGALIGFSDYPYPIPVMAGWQYKTNGATSWTDITSDGEINSSGTFSGRVRAFGTLSVTDWFTEETVTIGQQGLRKSGTPLSYERANKSSFVNGNKGYVCGGRGDEYVSSSVGYDRAEVDVYDIYGNRTTGIPLSVPREQSATFVNGNKGYVCAGQNEICTDVYDISGNRTTGTSLSVMRGGATSFVNGNKGYVCGGYDWMVTLPKDTVDVYDISGNRTTGTSLSYSVMGMVSFVVGNKGYVCGGINDNYERVFSTVDVYDTSGNRTTGTSLSDSRGIATSFVNGNKGYVCGGKNKDNSYANGQVGTVDVYDSSGNRTTGTSLSVARFNLSSFTMKNRGYVCGGNYYNGGSIFEKTVDVYDTSGNRTTGTSLSATGFNLTTFVNGDNGYVCHPLAVDIYYDEETITYEAKIPITAGSTYTLNGTSGVAETSEVLHFDDKVTGTVKYKDGDLYPSLDITVYDEDGTVATGADVVIEDLTCIATLILRDEDGTVLTGIDMNIEKVE